MGGLKIDVGVGFSEKAATSRVDENMLDGWHVHWYVYPLLFWMELLTDLLCVESSSFDLAYVTELDPLWNSDALSLIINPEAGLFTSLPAQLACAADCARTSSSGLATRELFWCMGCQGPSYPMTGNMLINTADAQGGLLAAERLIYKLHRQLVAWDRDTSGQDAQCQKIPAPIIDKRQYRWQMTNPVAKTKGQFTCPTTGATHMTYHQKTVAPLKRKDLGYLVWRKRNCCAL